MELLLILSSLAFIGLVIFCLQIWAVRSTVTKEEQTTSDLTTILPPISVLKPLKGLEDNLFNNLASFCIQDYPEYEIICSLQDMNDPAYKVAQKVRERFPERRIVILVERRTDGLNPKVNNLSAAYGQAQHPTILISDSNVMVPPGYLKRVGHFMGDKKVGLVTNLIRGVGARTLGSMFENLHLNSFILGNVCFLNKLVGIPCVIGKSMLMRKEDLEAIGGLKAFKDVLAEDHLIGEKIRKRGQKVVVSSDLIDNVNEYWDLKKFLNRHVRWGKMRWKLLGFKYVLELLINPVLFACVPILFYGFRHESLLLSLCVGLMKGMGDLYLGQLIGAELKPWFYVLSPFKDLLMGFVWFIPFVSDTVTWRGNRYLIGTDTLLSHCPSAGVWALKYRVVEGIRARIA